MAFSSKDQRCRTTRDNIILTVNLKEIKEAVVGTALVSLISYVSDELKRA